MDSFKLLTSVYELGLGCGLWSKEEVIQWCDKVIEVKDSPPYEMIEVSLMSKEKIDDIQGKLCELSREVDKEYAVKLVLSVIHEKFKNNQFTIAEAIKCTARLLVQTGLFWEDEYFTLYSMEDNYDLATDGIQVDLEWVIETYMENLEVYHQYFVEFKAIYSKEMNCEWLR